MPSDPSEESRKRSVGNLQSLYTVVVSLAVTELLKRLFVSDSQQLHLPPYPQWFMLLSFLATVTPFYHGANRYLDATYVTGERPSKHGALMLDFMALFLEGMCFFILAVSVVQPKVFYTILAGLFLFDALWVGSTYLTITDKAIRAIQEEGFAKWASANIIAAICICLFVWSNFWPKGFIQNFALLVVSIGRTVYDYISVWPFYYPRPAPVTPRKKRQTVPNDSVASDAGGSKEKE